MDVSLIITAYNYAPYVEKCINSCLFQEDSSISYEVIFVDDGSTDQTPLILSMAVATFQPMAIKGWQYRYYTKSPKHINQCSRCN